MPLQCKLNHLWFKSGRFADQHHTPNESTPPMVLPFSVLPTARTNMKCPVFKIKTWSNICLSKDDRCCRRLSLRYFKLWWCFNTTLCDEITKFGVKLRLLFLGHKSRPLSWADRRQKVILGSKKCTLPGPRFALTHNVVCQLWHILRYLNLCSICVLKPRFSQKKNIANHGELKRVTFWVQSFRVLPINFAIDLVTVFDAILTSRQTRLRNYSICMRIWLSNNFRRMAVLKKKNEL